MVLVHRRGGRGVAEQVVEQPAQIDASVEAVGRGAELMPCRLAELEALVAGVDQGVQRVSRRRIRLGELGRFGRFARYHHDVRVGTGIDHSRKAGQRIAANLVAGQKDFSSPPSEGLPAEGGQGGKLDGQRMALLVRLHRREDGYLVGGAMASSRRFLADEIGVVDLHVAVQRQIAVAADHQRGDRLAMDQPGGLISGAQEMRQRQRRRTSLVLADERGRQKLGAARQRTCSHSRLIAERAALVQPPCTVSELLVLRTANEYSQYREASSATIHTDTCCHSARKPEAAIFCSKTACDSATWPTLQPL